MSITGLHEEDDTWEQDVALIEIGSRFSIDFAGQASGERVDYVDTGAITRVGMSTPCGTLCHGRRELYGTSGDVQYFSISF